VHADFAPDETTAAVLEVLAGDRLDQVAARAGMNPVDLAEAVEVFHVAGEAALRAHAPSHDWFAVRIQPTDWDTAEHAIATHLAPRLRQAQDNGILAAWWFLRKHPCWRLRLYPGAATTVVELAVALGAILDDLAVAGLFERWWAATYEPEVFAFGGPPAMAVAHRLFYTDSTGVLGYVRHLDVVEQPHDVLGRRELSVLLCSSLFRAAGQDWYERGDIWHRVVQMRPLPNGVPVNRLPGMAENMRRLLAADTGQLLAPEGPLSFAASWAIGFRDAGRDLADAGQRGVLLRGMRDVLAHHVIFHWNRIGLSATTQAILSRAARDAVMNPPHTPTRPAEDVR
jgi:thiopeptide-type bacteriocin biosynthesis protein